MTLDRWLSLGQILVPIFLAILFYAARKWLENMMDARIKPTEELVRQVHTSLEKRNGGSSVRDQFVFIREDIAEIKSGLASHIIDHNKKTTRAPRKVAK